MDDEDLLRVSGFVQQSQQERRQKTARLLRALCFMSDYEEAI